MALDNLRGFVYAVGAPVESNPFAPRPCKLIGPVEDRPVDGPVLEGPVTAWDCDCLISAHEYERRLAK